MKVDRVSAAGFENFTVSRWFSKGDFLSYLGVRDGVCAAPDREDIADNAEYREFCAKYHISLNRQQERAVQAIDGANLLLAVPGSGKTTVLVARLGYMILCKGISPSNILVMTFSKQAAKDMHIRFCNAFGEQLGRCVQFLTIHSVANGIVRQYSQTERRQLPRLVEDNAKIVRDVLKKTIDEFPSESDIAEATAAITYIKNMSVALEDIAKQDFALPKVREIYEIYKDRLDQNRLMDFDDQVVFAVRILKCRPALLAEYRRQYPYICVDEAQDTSKIQHELLRLLVGDQGNIFMVGDEDQSIYRFRGAFPQALLDFKDTYTNPYILWMETNYRSTPEIVNIAASFISRNQNRYPKNMVAHRESGEAVKRIEVASRTTQYTYLAEIAKDVPANTAVIYRDNDSAIPLIDLLDREKIPYRCPKREFRFFSHKVVLDVIAFMKLQQDAKDILSFQRICYKGGFSLDKRTVEYACNNVKNRQITFIEALKQQADKYSKIAERVEKFADYCKETESMRALDFLRYLDMNGYGKYMRENKMDRNKFELLFALANENPTVPDFIARPEELKQITSDKVQEPKLGIILTIAHSSKGLEYDSVYLLDIYDGQFPSVLPDDEGGRKDNMDVLQEERRLFYVAMTRAKNLLFVLAIKEKKTSFIEEILPLPEPPKPKQSARLHYTIDRNMQEFEPRQKEQKKVVEQKNATIEKATAMRYEKGYAEVRDSSFQTEEMVVDSFGVRWLQCERCSEIKQKEEFSLIGRLRRPGIGICTGCARKMN